MWLTSMLIGEGGIVDNTEAAAASTEVLENLKNLGKAF